MVMNFKQNTLIAIKTNKKQFKHYNIYVERKKNTYENRRIDCIFNVFWVYVFVVSVVYLKNISMFQLNYVMNKKSGKKTTPTEKHPTE